jgi:DNA polymerase-4
MNSYFATVEQQSNPLLRGRPIVVGGSPSSRTVVAAASIEAKKFGIKSGMSLPQALKLCPNVILVEGDQDKYMYVTTKFLRIFRDYTPLMEIFSIDEAFLDVTETQERFHGAYRIALDIKRRLREEVGEWIQCSIGIGPSRLIAKLASELKKPDGLVVVEKKDVPLLLSRTKLTDLCGIGERLEKHLINAGIDTIDKLRMVPEEFLVAKFGVAGKILHKMSLGEDSAPLIPHYEAPPYKSMGHHYTLPRDVQHISEVRLVLLRLSEMVGRRLREENYAGKTITLGLRTSDFIFHQKQHTIPDYINDGFRIYREANSIMEMLVFSGGIRMVGVSVSNLVKDYRQLSLFTGDNKNHLLLKALDAINDRYGEFTIGRASILRNSLRKRVGGYAEAKQFR